MQAPQESHIQLLTVQSALGAEVRAGNPGVVGLEEQDALSPEGHLLPLSHASEHQAPGSPLFPLPSQPRLSTSQVSFLFLCKFALGTQRPRLEMVLHMACLGLATKASGKNRFLPRFKAILSQTLPCGH